MLLLEIVKNQHTIVYKKVLQVLKCKKHVPESRQAKINIHSCKTYIIWIPAK